MTDWTSKENISTLATWIGIAILPILIKMGIDIDQATLTAVVSTVIVIGIAIYSSYNPNKIDGLGNGDEPVVIDSEEPVMNDEYELTGDDDGSC